MGKKKSSESGNLPAYKRRDKKTAKELAGYVDDLREQAAELLALIQVMKQLKTTSLEIDGVTMMDRGLKLTSNFNENVEAALVKVKHARKRESRDT